MQTIKLTPTPGADRTPVLELKLDITQDSESVFLVPVEEDASTIAEDWREACQHFRYDGYELWNGELLIWSERFSGAPFTIPPAGGSISIKLGAEFRKNSGLGQVTAYDEDELVKILEGTNLSDMIDYLSIEKVSNKKFKKLLTRAFEAKVESQKALFEVAKSLGLKDFRIK
jgi:hypothetical protein